MSQRIQLPGHLDMRQQDRMLSTPLAAQSEDQKGADGQIMSVRVGNEFSRLVVVHAGQLYQVDHHGARLSQDHDG